MSKRRDPTANTAIKNISAGNARLGKALAVARRAIELSGEDLRRR